MNPGSEQPARGRVTGGRGRVTGGRRQSAWSKDLVCLGQGQTHLHFEGCGDSWGPGWGIKGLQPPAHCWSQGGSEGPVRHNTPAGTPRSLSALPSPLFLAGPVALEEKSACKVGGTRLFLLPWGRTGLPACWGAGAATWRLWLVTGTQRAPTPAEASRAVASSSELCPLGRDPEEAAPGEGWLHLYPGSRSQPSTDGHLAQEGKLLWSSTVSLPRVSTA